MALTQVYTVAWGTGTSPLYPRLAHPSPSLNRSPAPFKRELGAGAPALRQRSRQQNPHEHRHAAAAPRVTSIKAEAGPADGSM